MKEQSFLLDFTTCQAKPSIHVSIAIIRASTNRKLLFDILSIVCVISGCFVYTDMYF